MLHTRIEVNPKIMMGKPVIKGTRITVESILEKLAAGEQMEQILEAHPRLIMEDIKSFAGAWADMGKDFKDFLNSTK